MSDWNRAFRNDHTEPKELSEEVRVFIEECRIVKSPGLKTWRDVYIADQFVGMIRVKLCGFSEYKLKKSDEPTYCGDAARLNQKDSIYSLAVLGLRDAAGV